MTTTIGTLNTFAPDTKAESAKVNANFAEIKNKVNTHNAATTLEHGVTGTIVGTSDTQVLTNKTLTAPVINGGSINTATATGCTLASPTITGTATVSGMTAFVGSLPEVGFAAAATTPTANKMVNEAIVKAWGVVYEANVTTGYNVQSSTDDATGVYSITLKKAFTDTNYCVVASARHNLPSETLKVYVTVTITSSSSFTLRIWDEGGVARDAIVYFIAMGAQ